MNPEVGPASVGARRASPVQSRAVRRGITIGLGALLVALSAQVVVPVPFSPVPMTLQPLAVLAVGGLLGAVGGFSAMVVYLILGVLGLPVFAPGGLPGALRLIGPTGGYLMSYPFAAWVAGHLAERGFDRRYVTSVIAMAAGLVVVFAGGVMWLGFVVEPSRGIGGALAAGFVPFVLPDLVKLLAAAGVMPALWWLTGRTG